VTQSAPEPVELAEDLVCAVGRHLRFDLAPLRAELAERLREPSEEYVWPRAERIVSDLIDSVWSQELVDQCERAVADAHEGFLVAAARCLGLADELATEGREAWIAGAMRHRLAFDATWDVLAEEGRLDESLSEAGWFPPEEEAMDRAAGDPE
jgi:hypothetical protein